MRTQNGISWSVGVTNTAVGKGDKLCSDGVLHAYRSILEADVYGFAHTRTNTTVLIEVESSNIVVDDGCKVGSKSQTMIRVVEFTPLTTEQRLEIAIRCALLRYSNSKFKSWATAWLDGSDRSSEAASAAADAVDADSFSTDSTYAAIAASTYASRAANHAATAANNDAASSALRIAASRAAAYAATRDAAYAAAYAAATSSIIDIAEYVRSRGEYHE